MLKEKIGILWDLDGTIIDSVGLYYQAYKGVFKKYALGPFTTTLEEYRGNYFGASPEVFLRAHIRDEVPDELMAAMKWDYLQFAEEYLMNTPDGGIRMIPGVDRVLKAFCEKGYPMSIASTSWMPTIVHCLEKVGLLTYFADIASAILLPSKPAPDVFRLAAGLLNVPAERCVVFEDSKAGMKGAKNAGMKCVGISTSLEISQMTDADLKISSYTKLNLSDVEALFN